MCFACLLSTNIKPCVASVSNTNVMFVTFVLAGFVLTEWFVPSSSQLCGKARFLHLADHFGAPPFHHLIIYSFTSTSVSKYLKILNSRLQQLLARTSEKDFNASVSGDRSKQADKSKCSGRISEVGPQSNQERWETGPVIKDSPTERKAKWVQFTRWWRVTVRHKRGPSIWLGIREGGGKPREEMHRLKAHGRIKSRIKQITTFGADRHILAITHT